MTKTLILPLLTIMLLVSASCGKEANSNGGGTEPSELEKKVAAFKTYLTGKHFIPVDFYSSREIDYDQDDLRIDSITDLSSYILPYLADDIILLNEGGTISLNQGAMTMPPPKVVPNPLSNWEVTFSKAKNEIYLQYLDYYYITQKYTLSEYNDSVMIAHVNWVSKVNASDTATLYTKFRKK